MRRPAKVHRIGGPGPKEPRDQLVAWANGVFLREGERLVARVALAREGVVEEVVVEPLVRGLGADAVVQAAAIVGRTVGDDELVAILTRGKFMGLAGATERRTGLAAGWGAIVVMRARSGAAFAHMFHAMPVDRRQVQFRRQDVPPSALDHYGDWMSPDFYVDPTLDDHLASCGVAGAIRRVAPSAVAFLAPPAPSSRRPAAATPPREPEAQLVGDEADVRFDYPWEAARNSAAEMNDVSPADLGTLPFAVVPAAEPPGLATRNLRDLLERGWTGEAQATLLARRIVMEADRGAALRMLLDARLPVLAALFACAGVASYARNTGHGSLAIEAARELIERIDAAAGVGGLEAWLATRWPQEPGPGDEIGSVAISCASNAAVWRVLLAIGVREPGEASRLDSSLAGARALRDHLLDRASAPAGAPGARVARLGATVLGAAPLPAGEPRLDRWRDAIKARRQAQAPALALRDHAAFHAAVLHSVVAIVDLAAQRAAALDLSKPDEWRPDVADTSGLFTTALTVVARHCVQRATVEEDAGERVRLLAYARDVAPWDRTVAACFDEARFRAERWDERLRADLERAAHAAPSLAVCAEYLRVAERLGRRRDIVLACKRLRTVAERSEHAWIAEVRIAFARPQELADAERVKGLLEGSPPARLDPSGRAVFALYGGDPTKTVADYKRALAAQREALEWTALVAEVRAEEQRAPATGEGLPRPEVPRNPGERAIVGALAALRFRLDRSKLAKHPMKEALERHASRATELTQHELDGMGGEWLGALGNERGLVAALDDVLYERGSPSAVAQALTRAEAALDHALQAAWLGALYRRMSAVWPLLARVVGDAFELRRRAQSIEDAASAAVGPAARAAVERELTALLDALQADEPAMSAKDHDAPLDGEPEEGDDGFLSMSLDGAALERSRRELGTPEWALAEGLRQVAFFNLSRGRRDLKMLRGTRDDQGALWELRHRDGRHPVRVLYVLSDDGPRVVAILAKQDDAHQRRMIARVRAWSEGATETPG